MHLPVQQRPGPSQATVGFLMRGRGRSRTSMVERLRQEREARVGRAQPQGAYSVFTAQQFVDDSSDPDTGYQEYSPIFSRSASPTTLPTDRELYFQGQTVQLSSSTPTWCTLQEPMMLDIRVTSPSGKVKIMSKPACAVPPRVVYF